MKKHLFLSGPSGCGKTTLINNTLGAALKTAGGFVTVRMFDGEGKLLGYDLFPSAAAGGVEGYAGERFLDYSGGQRRHDNEVFRTTAVRLLGESAFYPFSLLDEFGGFEILIPEFREALLDFLSSEQPIIGVLKCLPNAQSLKNRLSLTDRYTDMLKALTEALKNDGDTLIVDMKDRYDENARRAVSEWAREYAGMNGGRYEA